MPKSACPEATAWLKVKIKAWRMHVFAAMRKPHGDVRLIRSLVGGKARIAIDAKQRSARRTWICHQVRSDFRQKWRKVADKANGRVAGILLVFIFVSEKPFAFIVAFE